MIENNIHCKNCASENCFLFKYCNEEWHDELRKHKSCIRYIGKQVIFREEDEVSGIYFIQKGKVKVYKKSKYRTQIIRFAKEGDILGHRGLGKDNKYPITSATLEDSVICFIGLDMFFNLL